MHTLKIVQKNSRGKCVEHCCGEVLRFNQQETLKNILNIANAACAAKGKILKVSFYLQSLEDTAKTEDKILMLAALEKLLVPVEELLFELSRVSTSMSSSYESFCLLNHDFFSSPCIKLTPEETLFYEQLVENIIIIYQELSGFLCNDYIDGILIIQHNLNYIARLIFEDNINWVIVKEDVALITQEVDLFIVNEDLFKNLYQIYQDNFYTFSTILLQNKYLDACKPNEQIVRC